MTQQYKIDKVNELKEELKDYNSFILVDYRGLNVPQISGLRNTLKEKGAHFHVMKNRLLLRVLHDLDREGLDDLLVNPTAVAYFNGDVSSVAKVLVDTSKDTALELKGGYLYGDILSAEDLINISKLPSRDVLLAQAVGLLNSPISGLAMVLNGVLSKFVRTLKAIEEKEKA